MLAELAALALTCAPNIHPVTINALIRHESGVQPYAIGVNRKGKALAQQPSTLDEAQGAVRDLIDQGIDFDAGLAQINVRNWAWLGLDATTVFDPCRNLAAAQTVLSACYARALHTHQDQQRALRAALSCYNTGNFSRGFANGYVGKVLAQAGIKVPALQPLSAQASTDQAGTAQGSSGPLPKGTASTTVVGTVGRTPAPRSQGAPDGFTAHSVADGFTPPTN
ncbi:lytic transglycosylase domain-containing protein [Castellaniella sp.]|uniref:lytic transglycosylase domain-containing protein n=1 Tax=Castellaniella sp. TaxID=1955812 RepID=UPI003A91390F